MSSLFTIKGVEGGSDGGVLIFDSRTATARFDIEPLKVQRGVPSAVLFDIKVTHPMQLVASPNRGTVAPGGSETVMLQLVGVDTSETASTLIASVQTTPMRVMIIGTSSNDDGIITQKVKLTCDTATLLQCIASQAPPRKKLDDDLSSTPRSTTPLPLMVTTTQCFDVILRLHELNAPPSVAEVAFPADSLVCFQWKRGSLSGLTDWVPIARDVGAPRTENGLRNLVRWPQAGSGHQILIEGCQPSEKRIILALGLVCALPNAPQSSLKGTLKLDTTRCTEEEISKGEFPLVVDGLPGSVLIASFRTVASKSEGVSRSTTPPPPPPTQLPHNVYADPSMDLPPLSRPAAVPNSPSEVTTATATPQKREAAVATLSVLRSQLDTLKSSTSSIVMSPLGGSTSEASAPSASDIATNPLRSFEKQMPKSSNVIVAVRIRPLQPFEQIESAPAWTYDQTTISAPSNDRTYVFDRVFFPGATTQQVYEELCPQFVDNALLGINGTIFMYGQTASGKTHTMFGSDKELGLTPRVIESLFTEIQKKLLEYGASTTINVTASYFEIYNEELNDLLDISRKNLPIRSSASSDGSFTVEVSQIPVRTAAEAAQVLTHGSYNKKVGQSHLNDRSSRSHSIFKLTVEVITNAPNAAAADVSSNENEYSASRPLQRKGKPIKVTSELCLVDLAGSENLQDKGGSSQRKETTNINLSLTYLKKVIHELAHKEKHVSYRNSALTKVLKQAIGGNSRTCVVCCMTPAAEHFRDSRNTLVFGTTAKSVVTTTKVNSSGGDGSAEMERLRNELERLRSHIEAYEVTVQAYREIEEDFKNVLQENSVLSDRVLKLQAENEVLRKRGGGGGDVATEGIDDLAAATSNSDNVAASDAINTSIVAEVKESASLRTGAQQHSSQLEEAISRLEQVTSADFTQPAAFVSTSPQPRTPASECSLDDDELFDEVFGGVLTTPRRKNAKSSRPPPPTSRPDGAKVAAKRDGGRVAAPRTIESLQLQLIQQTIDHRNELVKKDEEIRKLIQQQIRPTDEIPEIMKKEEKVCVLLDQLHSFLHHGTAMTLVFPQDSQISALEATLPKMPKSTPRCARSFMYLYTYHNKETFLCFCLVDPDDPKQPKRSSCFEKIPIKDIKRVELGQFSDGFDKCKAWAELQSEYMAKGVPPPAAQGLTLEQNTALPGIIDAHRKVYGEKSHISLTITAKKGKVYDCVCDDEADFEAWIIELNRLTGSSAEWRQPLDVSSLDLVETLNLDERAFCAQMHITPSDYVRAKSKLMKRRDKFITLFDVRALAQFDLYHSQRFFYFLRCQGWVAQAAVFYLTDKFAAAGQVDLDSL